MITLKIYDFTYLFSVFTCYLNDLWLFLNVLKKKTAIRMVGDSVFFSVVFSVVNFYKHTHFFSFYKFVNEDFHTFAPSYDLTKQ